MDGWTALYNWAAFGVVAGGLAYYYIPKNTKNTNIHSAPAKELRKESKKPARKPDQQKTAPPTKSTPQSDDSRKEVTETGNKKRKATAQPTVQTPAVQKDDDDEIDASTRQFAASMLKAREGIQVKSSNDKEARVKTVKPKNSPAQTPVLSSGSSQAGDVEDDWSPVLSSAPQAGGIDDMLEPVAAGPSSLRITAPERPVKEKTKKEPKQEVVESKKARQNRQKAERQKLERQEQEAEQKAKKEQQMRLARESRGEPAKNGISIPAAPVHNPWSEKNAARDAHLPAVSNTGSNIQLLDTLDTESNSSSDKGDSTAATSMTDSAPGQLADFTEGDLAKAIEESERDSGWNEVKSSKKLKKKNSNSENGNITPVASAPANNGKAASAKPNGYSALTDEFEQNGASAWTA
ncbi:hypothetical protein M409DRAFT_49720 [Zasmidium cellare ATCC 36951]|uniref:Uncharacterized protein n=1 Tax=Zasmidium cellare ATCC 36951 TaxID=1080233 RepID=A0A6A6D1E2_ZASCE|nr:uncharacterized protein M409DRAFT_49720 [Zasmidium cellare ATCC 36951]KAF2173247.1 hypothetical protein M409DRAFT_49720 [Zasmidium cellare ATCC 36951]